MKRELTEADRDAWAQMWAHLTDTYGHCPPDPTRWVPVVHVDEGTGQRLFVYRRFDPAVDKAL